MLRLEWRTSVLTSCLHAARQLVEGRALADERLNQALASPAHACWQQLCELSVIDAAASLDSADERWRIVLQETLDDPSPSTLAARLLERAEPAKATSAVRLATLQDTMTILAASFTRALPQVARELPLRVGPLREQWEARGPGLVARAWKLLEAPAANTDLRVVVLHPVLGGAGESYPESSAVQLEGLLTNTHPRLPEPLRLGWLVVQATWWHLAPPLPLLERRRFVAEHTLPAVIAAGQYVELAPTDPKLLDDARASWMKSEE